jgi:hypothetical protein
VFRNDPQLPADLADAFAAAARRVLPATLADRLQGRPRADDSATLATKAADGIRQAGGFGEPERRRFDWERFCTRDEYLDELPIAGFTRLPPDKLQQLLTDTGAAIDAAGGSFTVRYTTTVITAARTTTT